MEQETKSLHRLKSQEEISFVFLNGFKFKKNYWQFHFLPHQEFSGTLHFAISAPKRNYKLAVHRNFCKRIMREAMKNAFRQYSNKFALDGKLLVLCKGRDLPNYFDCFQAFSLFFTEFSPVIKEQLMKPR